jgi:hypothetical protein
MKILNHYSIKQDINYTLEVQWQFKSLSLETREADQPDIFQSLSF